jgi:hypothetical protein
MDRIPRCGGWNKIIVFIIIQIDTGHLVLGRFGIVFFRHKRNLTGVNLAKAAVKRIMAQFPSPFVRIIGLEIIPGTTDYRVASIDEKYDFSNMDLHLLNELEGEPDRGEILITVLGVECFDQVEAGFFFM